MRSGGPGSWFVVEVIAVIAHINASVRPVVNSCIGYAWLNRHRLDSCLSTIHGEKDYAINITKTPIVYGLVFRGKAVHPPAVL